VSLANFVFSVFFILHRKELRENVPKYAPLLGQLGGKFVATLLSTASKNIDTVLIELELSGEDDDPIFKGTVKGLSSAAQRGASFLASAPADNYPVR
jgi:hypothetical protein